MPATIGDDDLAIDRWSAPSLHLTTFSFRDDPIASATGFIAERAGVQFLVTAEHVFTGVNTETGRKLSSKTPERLRVFHHSNMTRAGIGAWWWGDEPLLNERGAPRWVVHPRKSIKDMEDWESYDIDVAVLPLSDPAKHMLAYPVDVSAPVPLLAPSCPVSIVGFPFGQASDGMFPIWKTGHIASDLKCHTEQRYFLVDITTRDGMSGAPVYARQWTCNAGAWDVETAFLGIYSGRIRDDAEIGIVWRAEIISAILDVATSRPGNE